MRQSIAKRSAAAMTQLQHNVPTATAGNPAANNASRDAQRQAASAQLKQATQRSNYRGYDSTPTQQQRREAAKTQLKTPRRSNSSVEKPPSHEQNRTPQQQQRRQQFQSATPAQRQQTLSHLRANALSGNESRAPPRKRSRNEDCRAASYPA
ncbi:hypothetical protein KPZU09_39540 [Klebsiella pneumoniae]|uniref:Uncharacterized protein n=1 Tax=Klebsiella pneumoniae TaxID=573 RepID=A0A919HVL4_KLEPN|nr:hypothetical protein KPZU09_39540 [Klebsiella pneumoniae]